MDLTQKSIWKFPIDAVDLFDIDMPKGAEILSVQVQNGTPCIWAMVDPGAQKEKRTLVVHGPGHPISQAEAKKFIGTVQLYGGDLVFHLFELIG